MSTDYYETIERSPETLHDDEELIVVVNELLENITSSIQHEIRAEVNSMYDSVLSYVYYLFPNMQLYNATDGGNPQLGSDIVRLIIVFLTLLVTIWFLVPSLFSWDRMKSNIRIVKTIRQRFLQAFASDDRRDEENRQSKDRHYDNTTTDSSYDCDNNATLESISSFEQLWDTSIQYSTYSKLVLPPSCCRQPSISIRQSHSQQLSLSAATTPTTIQHSESSIQRDDHPVIRMQSYIRELTIFITSIISYDYTTTGRTILNIFFNLYRIHWKQRDKLVTPATGEINEVLPLHPADNANIDGDISSTHRALNNDEKKDDFEMADHKHRRHLTIQIPNKNHDVVIASQMDRQLFTIPQSPMTSQISTKQVPVHTLSSPTTPITPLSSYKDASTVSFTSCYDVCSDGHGSNDTSHNHNTDIDEYDTMIRQPPNLNRLPSLQNTIDEIDLNKNVVKLTDSDSLPANHTKSNVKDFHTKESQASSSPAASTLIHNRLFRGQPIQRNISSDSTSSSNKNQQNYYFDTLSSKDSLKKMLIDIPVPDKHGYILGDDFLIDPKSCTPLLVFVNTRSGPQQGQLLIQQLRRLLNPIQVYDLKVEGNPRYILESFLIFTNLRILVCGGDGTVSWIIHTIEDIYTCRNNKLSTNTDENVLRQYPPVAILPLGTGNDLSRILGWGGGYNNESLIVILEQIAESYISLLDRWEVVIEEYHNKKSITKQVKGFFNYLGIGADAQAALQVHYLRESRPDWFFSRIVNKAMYGIFGAEDILKATTVNVRKEIQLFADGVEVPLPHDSQGIILLNIDSYAGGVPLWSHGVTQPSFASSVTNAISRSHSLNDTDCRIRHLQRRSTSIQSSCVGRDRVGSDDDSTMSSATLEERFAKVTACNVPTSCQDGYLDIVSIRGAFHLGQIKVGLSNALRLCQCREVTVHIKNKVAIQVDGEPWRQNACILTIKKKKDPAVMLHRSADDGGVEMEMSRLLDWAQARKMIDSHVHTVLMKEFSRRIESKTLQKRMAARQQQQDNATNFLHFTSTIKKAISSGALT